PARAAGRPAGARRADWGGPGPPGPAGRRPVGDGGRRGGDRLDRAVPGRGRCPDRGPGHRRRGGGMDDLTPPEAFPGDTGAAAAPDDGPAPVVAVVGRPNVGKSTLVNRILGSRQAAGQDVPGGTRDRVTYDANWRGRAFTLVDTGGWEPAVEGTASLAARVAAQARVAVDAADAVLFVVDAVVGVTDADDAVAAVLRRSGKPVVLA